MSRFNYIKGRRAQRYKLMETEGKIRSELEHKATDAVNRIVKTFTPDAASQMRVARDVMKKNRDVLRNERMKDDPNYVPTKYDMNNLSDEDRSAIIKELEASGLVLKSSVLEEQEKVWGAFKDIYTNPTVAPDSEAVKKRKLMKIDRFLLKQKVTKLQALLDSKDEDTLGILWLKEALNNILITRAKEFSDLEDKSVMKKMQNTMTNDQLDYLAVMTNDKPPLAQATVGQMFEIARKMGLRVNVELIKSSLPLETAISSDELGSKQPIYCKYVEVV